MKTDSHPLIRSGSRRSIDQAAEALRNGRLVAFPTETVYGLGGDATQDDAVAAIFAAKNRPEFNPLIIHFADIAAANRHVVFNGRAQQLAKRFWPGPLTLVLRRKSTSLISQLASAGLDTLAVRVPSDPLAVSLLRRANLPVAAPSANPSGRISPTTARHVADGLGEKVAVILDGGPCVIGVESSIIDLSGKHPVLLRPGGLSLEHIESLTGPLFEPVGGDQTPKSPGQLTKHYAPRLPLRCNATSLNNGEALLSFGPHGLTGFAEERNLSPSEDLNEAAGNLFRMLHELDHSDASGIAAMPVPEWGLGRAINDRLHRAAGIAPTTRSTDTAALDFRKTPVRSVASSQSQTGQGQPRKTKPGQPEAFSPTGFHPSIRHILGEQGVINSAAGMAPYLKEWRGLYQGKAALVARPSSVNQVVKVVAACRRHGISIVPQGGNTGLVGGATPLGGAEQIVLSLERMNRIGRIDPADNTITVEAGCILSDVQAAAADAGRLFPLRMASEGSCRIGGNIATNAGGVAVLRYGPMRDLVLGIEAVLPNGQVFDSLKRLRKDNTGYDLKQLFIGSEGTLGIITAAVLKLFPRPSSQATVMAAFSSPDAALDFFHQAGAACGDSLTAFELIPRIGLDLVIRHIADNRDPFPQPYPWYALIEISVHGDDESAGRRIEPALADAIATGRMDNAVVAAGLSQTGALWRLRESLSEAQTREGGSIKHDVSVPISAIPAFLDQAGQAVENAVPGARPVAFGHVGDGNIHFNISQPVDADKNTFLDRWLDINRMIHDIAHAHGGSISAEHGIGLLKREELARLGDPSALDLMRRIKQTIDPHGIMNPGKIL